MTFDDVVKDEVGTVYVDEFSDGIRFAILRGPGSVCAYVGVPVGHPLAGFDYNLIPLDCHGGLTYSGTGVHGNEETFWYGWDYNHPHDRSTYDSQFGGVEEGHGWTPEEVHDDARDARYDFAQLVALAERIVWKDRHG